MSEDIKIRLTTDTYGTGEDQQTIITSKGTILTVERIDHAGDAVPCEADQERVGRRWIFSSEFELVEDEAVDEELTELLTTGADVEISNTVEAEVITDVYNVHLTFNSLKDMVDVVNSLYTVYDIDEESVSLYVTQEAN